MSRRIRAFEMSILIHILFITAVAGAGALLDKPRLPMVISFDVVSSGLKDGGIPAPSNTPRAEPSPAKQTVTQTPKDPAKIKPNKTVAALQPLDAPAPSSRDEEIPSPSRPDTGDAGMVVSTGTSGMTGSESHETSLQAQGEDGDGNAQERYGREHYLYIIKCIDEHKFYPQMARRMKWQGKVLTSFIINRDGTASDIRIVNSSGHKILDENAVTTIKNSSPFPKPPIPAKIIISIPYQLNSNYH